MAAGDIPQTKICGKCGISKPLNAFAKCNTAFLGVHSTCKNCRSIDSKKYREHNREELNRKCRECYHKTIKEQRKRAKKYYDENKEELQARRLKYRQDNHQRVLKQISVAAKKRRQGNPKAKINGHMKHGIWVALKENKRNRHWEDLVGFTLDDLKKHLEKQFTEGMAWNNYGKGGWEIDHKIPQSAFNFTKPEHEDFLKCWSLKNLQPLWAKENRSKHNKLTKHFQPSLLL